MRNVLILFIRYPEPHFEIPNGINNPTDFSHELYMAVHGGISQYMTVHGSEVLLDFCWPVLVAPVAEARAWVGICSGRTRWCCGGRLAGLGPGWGEGGRRLMTRDSRARSFGTLGLGRPEILGPLARMLVARARNGRHGQVVPDQGRALAPVHGVTTACEPRGSDWDQVMGRAFQPRSMSKQVDLMCAV